MVKITTVTSLEREKPGETGRNLVGGEGAPAVKAAPHLEAAFPLHSPCMKLLAPHSHLQVAQWGPFDDYKELAARALTPGLCYRENLDSSHLDSAAGRAAPVSLRRLGGGLSNHLPAPPPSVAWLLVPMRAQSGLRVFMSRVGPLGWEESAGTHSSSHPSHLHSIISPLEARGELFSCCCFSMIS